MTRMEVPWFLGPALITGRQELVRLCMAGQPITPEDVKKLLTFSEMVVAQIHAEREVYTLLEHEVAEMGKQMKGMAGVLDRVTDALRRAQDGWDPEAVRAALQNPRYITKTHGDSSQCPEVKAGRWVRCLGHKSEVET